jgi:hypothetical protein
MRKEQAGSRPIDRRRLLKGAGLAAGAAATSAVAAGEAVAGSGDAKSPSPRYRETADVKAYYKSARY